MRNNKLIDLFSGVGGFTLGAHSAGFQTILAVDIHQDLTYSYKANFPYTELIQGDLSRLQSSDLLGKVGEHRGAIAGIIGGPPCQGFSYMGNRNREDPRNSLVAYFFKLVRDIDPIFFIMENVPGLITDGFVDFLHSGLELISHRYRIIEPLSVNAINYGVPTNRKRALVFGYRPDYMDPLTESDIRAVEINQKTTVREALSDLPPISAAFADTTGQYWARYHCQPDDGESGNYARAARRIPPTDLADLSIHRASEAGVVSGFKPTRHTSAVVARFATVKPGKMERISKCQRLSWEGFCPTLRAGTGKDQGSFQSIRPIHPDENRVITVREAARLQGFPDWFQFHPTLWHSFRMIGNSIPPPLAEAILKLIAVRLEN